MKQRIVWTLFGVLATFGIISVAGANVVYNWETVSPPNTLKWMKGQLVITDQAWRSGHIGIHYGNDFYGNGGASYDSAWEDGGIPDSPIVSLVFGGSLFGNSSDWENGAVSFNRNDDFSYYYDLTADLSFDPDSHLMSGYLGLYDSFTQAELGGDPLWTVNDFNGDYFADACFEDACTGATGHWVLDPSSLAGPHRSSVALPGDPGVAVPEPGALGLVALGLGLLSLMGMRLNRKAFKA